MPRQPKADREAVKTSILAIRLDASERAMLERLVAARAEELSRLAGQPLDVTAAAYLRWLMLRDAEARGFVRREPKAPEPAGLARGAAPSKGSPPKGGAKPASKGSPPPRPKRGA